jgi:hypothetical protein
MRALVSDRSLAGDSGGWGKRKAREIFFFVNKKEAKKTLLT